MIQIDRNKSMQHKLLQYLLQQVTCTTWCLLSLLSFRDRMEISYHWGGFMSLQHEVPGLTLWRLCWSCWHSSPLYSQTDRSKLIPFKLLVWKDWDNLRWRHKLHRGFQRKIQAGERNLHMYREFTKMARPCIPSKIPDWQRGFRCSKCKLVLLVDRVGSYSESHGPYERQYIWWIVWFPPELCHVCFPGSYAIVNFPIRILWPFVECLPTTEVSFAEALFPVTWKSRGAKLVSDVTGKRGLKINNYVYMEKHCSYVFSQACVRV